MADKQLEQLYISAYNRIKNAKTAADYQDAITLLKKCNGFADSESLLHQCEENIYQLSLEESYQNAINLSSKKDSVFLKKAAILFEELGDFKDSKERLNEVRRKIDKINTNEVTREEISCPKCGHINHGGENCSKCGAPLKATSAGEGKNKKNILIVLGVALFLALIVYAIVLLNQPNDKEENWLSDESDSSYTNTVDNIPEDAIDNMDNIAFGRAYTLYEESLDAVDDMNESDLCWRALHLCFMQEYSDLNDEGKPPRLYNGYYAVPEERVHEAMYACFGNDDAWGVSSSEYEVSETEHIAFVIGNADVSLERLETTVSDDKKTATVEYILKEYEDYDGDGNQEAARFTIDYVPNEYVQIDSEKPLYYKIDNIDFELLPDNVHGFSNSSDSAVSSVNTNDSADPSGTDETIDTFEAIQDRFYNIVYYEEEGLLTRVVSDTGIYYYYYQGELVKVNVPPFERKNADGVDRTYYYDNGEVFYIETNMEGYDMNELYYMNGKLVRVVHSKFDGTKTTTDIDDSPSSDYSSDYNDAKYYYEHRPG